MYAVWNFPVSNFHINMFMKLNEDRYIVIDHHDYDDAVFRMENGTKKGRNYFAFFSKLRITLMREMLAGFLFQVT